jgi:hypothetical protein
MENQEEILLLITRSYQGAGGVAEAFSGVPFFALFVMYNIDVNGRG